MYMPANSGNDFLQKHIAFSGLYKKALTFVRAFLCYVWIILIRGNMYAGELFLSPLRFASCRLYMPVIPLTVFRNSFSIVVTSEALSFLLSEASICRTDRFIGGKSWKNLSPF